MHPPTPPRKTRGLSHAAMLVSLLTLLSRITGLIRENLVASIFGVSSLTDAFFIAQRLPNMLRRIFAEGAFSQAFVPILAKTKNAPPDNERNDHAKTGKNLLQHPSTPGSPAKILIDNVATLLFWGVSSVCLLGMAFAPQIVAGLAPGLMKDPSNAAAAAHMTRWLFPYLVLVTLVTLAAGILNTWRIFFAPAISPVLLNIVLIVSATFFSHLFHPPIYALVIGTILGGALQVATQIPALHRIQKRPTIFFRPSQIYAAWKHPSAQQVIRRMGPSVLAVSVAQVSLVVNAQIASYLTAGSISWITYSDRLMEFPTALLGTALGIALLPTLSRMDPTSSAYSRVLDWGLRLTVLIALPAMAGFFVAAEPLCALLFHYGKFSAHDLSMTGQAVQGYAFGLLGLAAIKILTPAFYAQQDTVAPTKIAIFTLAITQAFNAVTVPYLQHAGLTLSISLGATFNAFFLITALRRRGWFIPQPGWRLFLFKTFTATLIMAYTLERVCQQFDWYHLHRGWRAVAVLGVVGGAAVVYFTILWGLRIKIFSLFRAPKTSTAATAPL